MDESWMIAELAELAAEALGTPRALGADTSAATSGPDGGLDDGPGAGPLRTNGRVRDVPNQRPIPLGTALSASSICRRAAGTGSPGTGAGTRSSSSRSSAVR